MSEETRCDVLVIGAGAAGIPAAVAAARAGARVMLVEEDMQVGGAMVDQFVTKPGGAPRGGITGEYLEEMERRFKPAAHTPRHHWSHWFLPSAFTRVFSDLLGNEKNLQVRKGVTVTSLLAENNGDRDRVIGARIWKHGIEELITADVTIDATGSGALLEHLGRDVLYGEDARDDFQEEIAPAERTENVQQCSWMYISQKRRPDASPLEPSHFKEGLLEAGYNFIDLDPEGFVARNTGLYLHWGSAVECPDTRDPETLADAQEECLNQMADDFAYLDAKGYAVYLAPKIGVREERRVVGEHVLNFNDMRAGSIPEDSVTITGRSIDLWKAGKGHFDYPEIQPYGIPYRSLLPRNLDGLLLAGKHISASHIAMASFRVEVILGNVGQAAGVAAWLATSCNCAPRDVEMQRLMDTLRAPPQNVIFQ